jgi:membrane protease YdiL (CAAX protease family)
MKPFLVALAVLAFYGLFYRYVVARWGPAVRWAMRRLRLDARRPVREVEAVGKLGAAGVAQLLFALALAWWTGLPGDRLIGAHVDAGVWAAAALLGAGELMLTSLVCTAIVEIAVASSGSGEQATRRWAAGARGGWMSLFLLTARAAPSPLAIACVCLYVAVEELVFRGILVTTFAGWGGAGAVCASAALFVAVQAFGMPSRSAAVYPIVGATVIGVVHGVLFWLLPAVAPLVLAHIAFFAAALTVASPRALPSTQ